MFILRLVIPMTPECKSYRENDLYNKENAKFQLDLPEKDGKSPFSV